MSSSIIFPKRKFQRMIFYKNFILIIDHLDLFKISKSRFEKNTISYFLLLKCSKHFSAKKLKIYSQLITHQTGIFCFFASEIVVISIIVRAFNMSHLFLVRISFSSEFFFISFTRPGVFQFINS